MLKQNDFLFGAWNFIEISLELGICDLCIDL